MSETTLSPSIASPRSGSLWLASFTLWQREMVRFFRQRNRVIGALATPLVFWLMLGSGLNRSFTVPAAGGNATSNVTQSLQEPPQAATSYLEYFYPGTVILVLLFTAIFSTFSVIEDRREGFLQAVLVAPIPRLAVVAGKVLGGASIATIQGTLFLILWPLVGHWPGAGAMLAAIVVMFVVAMGLTALSLGVAWPMSSTAGFHVVMNLFLMPMWFLSGAVFPVDTAAAWTRIVMWANPLMYGQVAFSAVLSGQNTSSVAQVPLSIAILVTIVFTVAMILLAAKLVAKPRKDGSA